MSEHARRAAAYAPLPVLEPAAHHLVSRFSHGVTPALTTAVRRKGHLAWFEEQLRPARVADPAGDALAAWWPDLSLTPLELWTRQVKGVRGGWDVMRDYGSWLLARRHTSTRQVLEVVTGFWENHLHVPVTSDGHFTWRARYGALVRQHALGRFDRMLVAAVTHPAMLLHLDAARSTAEAPNENLGRELLELFTVGVGRYTEDDVKDSARILTGWHVDTNDTWQAMYVPEHHSTGPVRVGTFRDPNPSRDGRALTRRYLTHLAHHPDTAAHLARKLAVTFVSDDPPAALVRLLARTYLEHDTAIVPVLRALVRSPAFRAAAGAKLRDPSEDVVATYRALGVRLLPPVSSQSATAAMLGSTGALGLTTGTWPRPDGAPTTNAAWSSPLRVLASVDLHWSMAHQSWPSKELVHRATADYLPPLPVTLQELVDHVSRIVLGKPAPAYLVEACALATGYPAGEVVTAEHALVKHHVPKVLATLLDSPDHYSR
ncbi:DUF1800 domain-containing protein [Nocardioides sp. SOB77]|uniref:DUF1800 domain-containing protein n=1 Tax=Nocardioides oceani TaxID=3058369 RepID=A0ABT8FCU1_9ACTN|nr:DUF1800 domain-containing protein [Nocardioides oceani]MDN4172508.1 DUF1800 domain-containing protein [Nocardioides oceani]